MKMKFLLSIDGGGVKNLMSAHILYVIKRHFQVPLYEVFDMVGGTSSGGITALGLSCLSIEDILSLYSSKVHKVFVKNYLWSLGLTHSKYNGKKLENFLKETFSNITLADLKIPTIISSYDMMSSSPFFMTNIDKETKNIFAWQAARATSAAPVYFPSFELLYNEKIYNLIDGGVFINNPGIIIYEYAKTLWPNEPICLLSIGTGEKTIKITYEESKNWGAFEWIGPLLSAMFDGQNDLVDLLLMRYANDKNNKFIYFRINDKLTEASNSMDEISSKNIKSLLYESSLLIRKYNNLITNFCKKVKEYKRLK